MKIILSQCTVLPVLLSLLIVISCSDSESRMPNTSTATVVINMNLQPENNAAADDTLGAAIRRIFVQDAVAQTAPATFSQVKVRVTGPDFGAIEKVFSPNDFISLDVPAGSLRGIEVTAYVFPGDPSAAVSFRGTAYANLPAGEIVSVPVVMRLNEAKIVVPDWSRIVMKDAMHSGWYELTTYTQPMDIDFDSRGRIYISDGSDENLWRVDNINGDNPVQINGSSSMYFNAVAVDRVRDRVFYSDGYSLYQNTLSGGDATELTKNLTFGTSTVSSINGMDVAPDGKLYIAGQVDWSSDVIVKFNPDADSGNGVIESTSLSSPEISSILQSPEDVQVQWPYIYVTNSLDGYLILKLQVVSNSFILANQYGTSATSGADTTAGHFYGPFKFVGRSQDGLIVMDHMISSGSYSRIVFFNNDFGGWDTLGGAAGSGVDQFDF
jgi:hypothetical protein